MAVQINVQASQTALAQSIAQGIANFNTRLAGQNQLNLQINSRSFTQPLGRITSDLADFESAMKASNARVLAFGASTAVLGGAIKTFKEIADATIEVEKSLTDINRVLGLSVSGLQKFSSELFSISKQTAVSFQEASKAALEFSRQGLTTEETLKRTKDALILVRLTGVDSAKAVEDLTAAVNGFSKEGLDTITILNKVVAVEQKFSVSARDITEALSRTGQAAQEAGVGFDELNALVAAAQQTTARGGAVIGNALKTIFTRLQRTETLDQLERFNIQVRDFQGNILPAVQILKNFSEAYRGLADSQKAYLSEQVAGVYQVNILKAIVGDLNNQQGVYNNALKTGAAATNEATLANEKLNQTLSALLTQTTTGLQQLGNNIGKVTFEPIFKNLISPINDAIQYINETLEGEGIGSVFAEGLLKGLRNVIAGPGLVTIFAVLMKIAKNTFVDLTKALPAILGITTEAQKRANIEKSILQILQSQGTVAQALQGYQGNTTAQAQLLLNLAKAQTAQYQQQLTIAQQLAQTLSAQGVNVGARGLQVGPRIRAAGYIPNQLENAEKMGALMGGYVPGKVIPSPVGGVMNSAEKVKFVPGFAQPFINPPLNSRAGKMHRINAVRQTGVDPYMYDGFIPNFASPQVFEMGRVFEKELYQAINQNPLKDKSATLDFPKQKLTLARKKDPIAVINAGVNKQSLYGDAKLSLNNENITSMISKYIRFRNIKINKNEDFEDPSYSIFYKNGPGDSIIQNKKRKLSSLIRANPSIIDNVDQSLIYKNTKTLNKKGQNTSVGMTFFGDKVLSSFGFIPNFAGIFGQPSNAKIASMISRGEITSQEAYDKYGYVRSEIKTEQRAKQTAEKFKGYGFDVMGIPGGKGTIGGQFESLALNYLKGKYPNVIPAASYGGLSGGSTNTRIDALQVLPGNGGALFEFKGGDPTTYGELGTKFATAKNEIKNLVDKWKNIVVYNSDYGQMKGPKAAFRGFIPNFAYKNAVMNLEENMSGKKAIFSTSPFPHIRNSGQPTFASAIADHGGLGNAINDAYKNQSAAGLMSKGFVPNFAQGPEFFDITGISTRQSSGRTAPRNKLQTEINAYINSVGLATKNNVQINNEIQKLLGQYNLQKQDYQNLRKAIYDYTQQIKNATQTTQQTTQIQTRAAGIRTPSLTGNVSQTKAGASKNKNIFKGFENVIQGVGFQIAAPMIAGQIESLIQRGRERSQMGYGERFAAGASSLAITGASTGAFIGSAILPGIGTAAGAVVGALGGLTAAAIQAKDTLDDLAQAGQKDVEKEENKQRSIENYIQALEKAQEATSPKEKIKAESEIRKAFERLTPDQKGAIGSERDIVKIREKRDQQIEKLDEAKSKRDALLLKGYSKATEEQRVAGLTGLLELGDKNKTLGGVLKVISQSRPGEEVKSFLEESPIVKNLPKDIQEILMKTFGEDTLASMPRIAQLRGMIENRQTTVVGKVEKPSIEKIKSATEIFQEIELYLDETSFIVKQSLNKETAKNKIQDSITELNQSLVKAFTAPTEFLRQQIVNQITNLRRDFDVQTKAINLEFIQSFTKAFEASSIKTPQSAQAFQDLLNRGATSPEDINKFLKKYVPGQSAMQTDVLNMQKLVLNAERTEKERKNNLQIEEDNINAKFKVLTNVEAKIKEIENKNIIDSQKLQFQQERILEKQNINIKLSQLRRKLAVEDPETFYGKTIAQETEIRINEKSLNVQEDLAFFEKQKLLSAKQLLTNQNGLLESQIYGLRINSQEDENLKNKLIQSQEQLNNEIETLDSLRSQIKNQEELVALYGENTDERKNASALLENLKDIEAEITGNIKEQTESLKIQSEYERKRARDAVSFRQGLRRGFSDISRETETFNYTFGEKIPGLFRDGLVGAMDAAINKTDDLGNALMDVAANFLKSIQSMLFQNVANQVVSGIGAGFMRQKGGIIRAQNGMYISGGRTGDRNLALLEDGEYVLNRNAVKRMGGPGALDSLNFSAFPRFANGGRTSSGERILTPDVALNPLISSRGADASASVNLGAYSNKLSGYALENTIFIREYFDQQRQLQEEAERKRQQRRALIRSIAVSAASSAVLGGLGYGFGKMFTPKVGVQGGYDANPNSFGKYASFAQTGGLMKFNSGGYLPYGNRLTDSIPALLTGGEYIINSKSVRKYGVGGLNRINSGIARFENGGMVDIGMAGKDSQTSSQSTNNISVNITVNNQGNNKSQDNETVSGGNTKSDTEKYSDFSKRIKEAVVQVIVQEQRSGGLLDSTKKRTQ